MPLTLSFFERFGIFRLNRGPGPLVDLLGSMSVKAVLAALRLGIFEVVGDERMNVKEIARATGTDPSGLSPLLGVLDCLGYLKLKGEKYRNSAMTNKWLRRGSSRDLTGLFHHIHDMAARWEYLHESIREGRPPRLGFEWLNEMPGSWDSYHAGLKCAATLLSDDILKLSRVPTSARRLLDLGGGHGHYSIAFCRQHPSLSAVVFDWPPAESAAKQNITSSGLANRISFHKGDFIEDDIGSGYDLILMFNVIRIFRKKELETLFKKAHGALAGGGRLLIMDHLGYLPRSRFMRMNAYIVLLEIFNSTLGHRHHAKDIISLLESTGYRKSATSDIRRSPGLTLVTGVKIP